MNCNFRTTAMLAFAMSSIVLPATAQQAPLMPRAGSGFTVYFKKSVSDMKKREDLISIIKAIREATGPITRHFKIYKYKEDVIVKSEESRVADFTLGTTKTSDSGDSGTPITPGFIYQGYRSQLLIGFNPGNRADIKQGFGGTLLSPGSSTQGVNLLWFFGTETPSEQLWLETETCIYDKVKALSDDLDDTEVGVRIDKIMQANNAGWYVRSGLGQYNFTDTSLTVDPTRPGTVFSIAGGYQLLFEQLDMAHNSVQFGLSLGLTSRFVLGDIASSSNSARYNSIFGTNKKQFIGAEFTLFSKAGDAVPYLRLSYMGKNGLAGFSDVQAMVGMDIFPKLFSAK